MGILREKCEFKERCGKSGHYLQNGMMIRCKCLELEINKKKLKEMFSETPRTDTKLKELLRQNIKIQGNLRSIKNHVSGALLHQLRRKGTFVILDAYRLIEIFLEKDQEYDNMRFALDTNLLIMLLGFGDPRNRYLPELICQVLNRRAILEIPTWIILGIKKEEISTKYGNQVESMMEDFQLIRTSA